MFDNVYLINYSRDYSEMRASSLILVVVCLDSISQCGRRLSTRRSGFVDTMLAAVETLHTKVINYSKYLHSFQKKFQLIVKFV